MDTEERFREDYNLQAKRTPPELAADIVKDGIFLTGGTSNISHLEELFKTETGIEARLVENPQESIIRGLMEVVNNPAFNSLAYVPRDKVFD